MPFPRRLTMAFLGLFALVHSGCATAPGPDIRADRPQTTKAVPAEPVPPEIPLVPEQRISAEKEAHILLDELFQSVSRGDTVEPGRIARVVETLPEDPYGRLLAGFAYLNNGSAERARDEFTASLRLDPSSGRALVALGDLALAQGDRAEAEKFYTRASTVDPTPAAANKLARLLIEGGQVESAKETLENTLAGFPDDSTTLNNLAVSFDMMGMTARGAEILTGRKLTDPDLLRTRAVLHLKEGRPERARQDLDSVIESDPSGENLLLLGTADLQQGRLEDAEVKFRSAIASLPSSYEAYLNLGLALRRQGKFTEAEKTYLDGLNMAPHPDLHLNLGVLYELYRGEPALALEQYRRYIALQGPSSDRVREWVEFLDGVTGNQ